MALDRTHYAVQDQKHYSYFSLKVHSAVQISCTADLSADLSSCTALQKTPFLSQ